jgi:hypothetical protein
LRRLIVVVQKFVLSLSRDKDHVGNCRKSYSEGKLVLTTSVVKYPFATSGPCQGCSTTKYFYFDKSFTGMHRRI